jgi:hypothetical protein
MICGICGLEYTEEQEEKHETYHKEKFTGRSTLLLPAKARDMIRFWAEEKLKNANKVTSSRDMEEVDVARCIMIQLWYQDDYMKDIPINTLFETYVMEIRKRYPNAKLIPSMFDF